LKKPTNHSHPISSHSTISVAVCVTMYVAVRVASALMTVSSHSTIYTIFTHTARCDAACVALCVAACVAEHVAVSVASMNAPPHCNLGQIRVMMFPALFVYCNCYSVSNPPKNKKTKNKSLYKNKTTLYHSTFWPEIVPAIGWLRLIGSLKLGFSFAEYHLFSRALLQKRPIIIKSLLIVATPYDRTPLVFCNCYCVFKSPQRIKKKK